jgi:AhpD family alkylhydroperoxidase
MSTATLTSPDTTPARIPPARLQNPATLLPDALKGIQLLLTAVHQGGVPASTIELSHLRASQINGCSFCVDYGVRSARKLGVADDKLFAVSAWRESPHFTDAERAALALTEAATRLADREEAVPDAIWEEAARHFDEKGLASLVLSIGVTNLFNRINVSIRTPAGEANW